MRDAAPVFVFTIARSGGTLLAQMLGSHPEVAFASDPVMPMMKAIRDAAWRASVPPAVAGTYVGAPFQDGFATRHDRALLQAVLDADLAALDGGEEWPAFVERSRARAVHMCPDLVDVFDRLTPHGPWLEHLRAILRAIQERRGGADSTRVGFKEVWSVALWPMLARALPESRAIILLRDPRAVLSSMLALARHDPTQRGHCVSYVWLWKQLAAFALAPDALVDDPRRQSVVRYEDLVTDPGPEAERLCAFLGIPADPAMLDAAGFVDRVTGAAWAGNSSFEPRLLEVSARSVERWKSRRDVLSPALIEMIERLAGPEMNAFGYATTVEQAGADMAVWDEVFARENAAECSWHAGLVASGPANEWCEARDDLLRGAAAQRGDHGVNECFLFQQARDRIRAACAAPV